MRKMNSKTTVEIDGKIYPRYVIAEVIDEPSHKMIQYYHYREKLNDHEMRTFIETEGMYVHYLWDNHTELLQDILDKGELYAKVRLDVFRAEKAVKKQVESWAEQDSEILAARASGNDGKADRLTNMLKLMAEDSIYRNMLWR